MSDSDLAARVAALEAELERERHRARFAEALLGSVRAGVTAIDADRRQLYVNRAFSQMVGWEPEELIGRRAPFPYWAPELAAQIAGAVSEIVGRNDEYAREWVFQRKNGERFDVNIQTSPLVDTDGQKLGWVASMHDITEQMQLRRRLLRVADELRMLHAAVDASGEAIFLTDREGVFEYVNPRFCELYGWTAEEIVGKATPRIIKSGDSSADAYRSFWSRLVAGEVVRGTIKNRARDGRLVMVESSSNAIRREDGEITGFLAIQSDVTEREQLAEQLVQAQKMEAVARLAGGVAHDFNNLLAVILNFAGFALEQLSPADGAYADVEEILRAGERAASLTRQLLLLSRPEATHLEVLDLGEVVASTEKILRRSIGEDIELLVGRSAHLPPVKADVGKLTQIVMNLVVNARDAMPRGGRLRIDSRRVELSEAAASKLGLAPGPHVVLEVEDTGCGMPPEVVRRAFEPFFTTKGPTRGTGLGLSVVERIARELGGAVSVESELDRGTTFTVHLPATGGEPESRPSEAPLPSGAGKQVLVLEDDDAVRSVVCRMLAHSGYGVLEARHAGEALIICEREPGEIDVLLSDVVMPHLAGPEIAARLRALRPKMRIVFMSGYHEVVHLEQIRELGADFIAKPFSRTDLLRKLGELGL